MDVREMLIPLRRWWWLILAATALAAGSSYQVLRNQPAVYTTRTTLIVGSFISVPDPTAADLNLGRQLAQLYADIANRDPVRDATMEALGLTFLPRYVVRVPLDSQLIEIVVTDTSPQRAQAVSNELANQLILRSPTSQEQEDQQRQAFVQEQLTYLEEKIVETQDDITTRQDELAELVSAEQIADANLDISALQTKLSTLQTIYASLLPTKQIDASNTISVIEPAALPTKPIQSNSGLLVALAGAIGFILGSGAAFLLENLDNTVKTPEDAARLLKLPVIGYIGKLPGEGRLGTGQKEHLIAVERPGSAIVEAFRTLRTNLDFASVDKPLKTLLIASPGPEDGKTTVAINLALVMAKSGKRVLLLDADLRKPSVHQYLGWPNNRGLTEVFLKDLDPHEVVSPWKVDNLYIVTGGSPPPNPTEILASRRMDQALGRLAELMDVVLVDSPPFILADASVLASKVDGVLLVIRPGHTLEASAVTMLDQLKRAGTNIVGIVLNDVASTPVPSLGRYWYRSRVSSGEQRRVPLGAAIFRGWPWSLLRRGRSEEPADDPAKS